MVYVAQASDGRTITYRDGKRYGWLASLTGPLVPVGAVLVYLFGSVSPWILFIPLFYAFVLVPCCDWVFGEDTHNPPEEVVALMGRDQYYRVLLYTGIALLYLNFLVVAWFIGTYTLPWWGVLALTLGTGLTSGNAILIGHELGHKQNRFDRIAAQVVTGLVGYGHFCVEHNRGHHVQVATPEDCASSRMGETIYRFMLREVPGALRRGWHAESERLNKLGKPAWSRDNEILQSWALTLLIAGALVAWFGPVMIPFLLLHHFYAWYGLTQANYVEHYGLLRQKLASGRYELTEPRHSWNTNHIYSNIISFHLQRHSDHHANPLRPYHVLRDFENLPRLPSGYPGCFGLAAIPPLWFKVMNPRLLQWAGGDLSKVNIDPARKQQIYARYGQRPTT